MPEKVAGYYRGKVYLVTVKNDEQIEEVVAG